MATRRAWKHWGELGGTILCKSVKEKDLGVTINANMKVSEQCRIAASQANQILGMIRRNITSKEMGLIVCVCISCIRTLGTHNNQIIVTSRNTHALDQCGYFINSEIA